MSVNASFPSASSSLLFRFLPHFSYHSSRSVCFHLQSCHFTARVTFLLHSLFFSYLSFSFLQGLASCFFFSLNSTPFPAFSRCCLTLFVYLVLKLSYLLLPFHNLAFLLFLSSFISLPLVMDSRLNYIYYRDLH